MIFSQFRAGNPVRGEDFLGKSRIELSDQIYDTVISGNDVVLYAPPRFGKSSILLRLEGQLGSTENAVYIDGQNAQNLDQIRKDIQYHLGDSVAPSQQDIDALEYLSQLDPEFGNKGRKLYILLDEATVLFGSSPQIYEGFTNKLSTLESVRFVLGFNPESYLNLNSKASDAMNKYSIFEVAPYSREDTEEVLTALGGEHLAFSADSIDRIHEVSEGKPFYVQQFGSMLFRYHYSKIIQGQRPQVTVSTINECAYDLTR